MKKEDFMHLYEELGGNYEGAKTIADFKERLTADGFEHYVKDLFASEKLGFRTKMNGGYNDKGVDVWGRKVLSNGTVHYVVIQCKKWRNWPIRKADVSEFWGDVEYNRKRFENISFFFITTTNATKKAREYCEAHGIQMSDEKILLEMHGILNLYDWMDNLQKRYSEPKFRLFVKPDYFEKKRTSKLGFERAALNFRLDSAVQTSLLKNEMDAQFKKAWEELFAEGRPEPFIEESVEVVDGVFR